MRILFVDQFSSLAGGQQCLRDIVIGLAAQGHTVHAALPGAGALIGQLAAANVVVHQIPLTAYRDGSKSPLDLVNFALDVPRVAWAIRRIIKREAVDLVYANGPRVLPAVALATDRFVFHSHSLLLAGYAKRLAGLSLRGRDAGVIASSHFVAQPLTQYVPSDRLQVIYNGVADCDLPAKSAGECKTIGLIGRVSPEKGHLDFLTAARAITEKSADVRFVICGDGQHSGDEFLQAVKLAAQALPIEFVPWQQDVRTVLSRLDLLVVPSKSLDATPRVIPEALSAGVPVVAYRTGGIPELLDDDSLSPADDPGALACKILDVLADAEGLQRRRVLARQSYARRFTLDRYVQEIGTVLESELARFSNSPRIISPAARAAKPANARTTR